MANQTLSILVTGASGLLGGAVILEAKRRGHTVVGLYGSHPVSFPDVQTGPLDLEDKESIARAVRFAAPDLVIHAAAWTSVDGCEADPDRAYRLNARASGEIAAAAREAGARTAYISTDSVFDGFRGGYTEEDEPAPLNVYAKSKLEGEAAVLEADPDALVLRTNLYGWNIQDKNSLAEWVLNQLRTGEGMTGFDDVTFAPLLADDLAELILSLAATEARGVYHLASSDALSKYAFAMTLGDVFGLNTEQIQRGELGDPRTGQHALNAPRPLDTSLDPSQAREELGDRVSSWPTVRSGLERFRRLGREGHLERLSSFATS